MVGFQTMVIMDLFGMFYHPVVVRVRIFVLLLDLISAYCGGGHEMLTNADKGGGGGIEMLTSAKNADHSTSSKK